METLFAPADRASVPEVRDLHALLSRTPLLRRILGAVPDVLLLLNRQRQIVFANDAACGFLGVDGAADALGARPGEAPSSSISLRAESGDAFDQVDEPTCHRLAIVTLGGHQAPRLRELDPARVVFQ